MDNLHLGQGSLFDVKVNRNRIELIPLEVTEKAFTEEDFKRLDQLVKEEKKKGAKKITREFIDSITKI